MFWRSALDHIGLQCSREHVRVDVPPEGMTATVTPRDAGRTAPDIRAAVATAPAPSATSLPRWSRRVIAARIAVLSDRHDVVEPPRDQPEREIARPLDRDAIRDRRRRLDGLGTTRLRARAETARTRGPAPRPPAPRDAPVGRPSRRPPRARRRRPGRRSARGPARRRATRSRRRTGPDHRLVVEGVHEGQVVLLAERAGRTHAVVHRRSAPPDCAEGPQRPPWSRTRRGGMETVAGHPVRPRRVGERLRVVAGAARDDAPGVPDRVELGEGPRGLERPRPLQALRLDRDVAAAERGEARQAQRRRVARDGRGAIVRPRNCAGDAKPRVALMAPSPPGQRRDAAHPCARRVVEGRRAQGRGLLAPGHDHRTGPSSAASVATNARPAALPSV